MAKSITKSDIKEIVTEIVTKVNAIQTEQFKREIFHIHNILDKHNLQFMKLENKIDGIKNDMVQFKDDILHEIVNLQDDVAILTGYRDTIEDHDVRIGKLESNIFKNKTS